MILPIFGAMIEGKCLNCGNGFLYYKSSAKKFCCHKCSSDYNTGFRNPRYSKEERKCLNCEKTFMVKRKDVLNGAGKYCSYKCAGHANGLKIIDKWKMLRIIKKCVVCEKEISIKKSRNGKEGIYCSKKCKSEDYKKRFSGKNNPNWRGGITTENFKQRQTIEYKKWRKSVLERDNYTCKECGQTEGELHVHHKKSFSKHKELRTELSNGITLCFQCHKKHHPYLKELNGKNRTPDTK